MLASELTRLKEGELRHPRTQTYGELNVPQFLRDLGIRQVREKSHTPWVSFQCPFHHDLHPSAAMHGTRTTWTCHGCKTWGNATRFLAMLKGISTRQAHHRIMARDYETEIELPEPYTRKTRRASTGTEEDLVVQQEHAIELLQKGAKYSQAKAALVALYGVSARTAERRLAAARLYLGRSEDRNGLGARMLRALPSQLINLETMEVEDLHRALPVSDPVPVRGSTKTQNLSVDDFQRRVIPRPLKWPGARHDYPTGPKGGKVRRIKAGVYYQLATGRVVHESHRPKSEIEWCATGAITAVGSDIPS